MSTIRTEAGKQDRQIIAETAKKPNCGVINIKDKVCEDLRPGKRMDSVKALKTVSRTAIFKKLQSE